MPIYFKSKSLRNDVLRLLKKQENDELEIEDLDKITVLSLDYLADYNNDYNLKEIVLFRNLKELYLKDFLIGNEEINAINKLQYLEELYIEFCEFDNSEYYLNNENLNTVTIDSSENFKLKILQNSKAEYIFIRDNSKIKEEIYIMDLKDLPNIICLYINGFNIRNIDRLDKSAPNIEEINIDGSVVSEQELQLIINNANIEISHEKEYRPTL